MLKITHYWQPLNCQIQKKFDKTTILRQTGRERVCVCVCVRERERERERERLGSLFRLFYYGEINGLMVYNLGFCEAIVANDTT